MAHGHRIALARIDLDQVIPERRQHRLRDFPRLERIRGRLERRDESPFRTLPERAAIRGGHRVGRLGARDILELLTAENFRPEGKSMRANRGGICRGHRSRHDDDRDLRCAGALEQLLVGVVVGAHLVVAHPNGGVGDALRLKGHEGDLRCVVRVLESAPHLLARDVHVARDLVEELFLRDLRPVILLELEEETLLLCQRAGQEALVLCWIELTLGLQVGRLHELRGRAVACRLENFVV